MPHPSRTSLRPPVVARRDARPSRARPRRGAALVLLAMALLLAPPHRLAAATPDDPTRVLIVYNTAMADWDGDGVPDSLQVAQYYAAKRHVPAGNLLAVTCSSPNMYDPNVADGQWANVVAEVIRPIKDKLAQLGPRNIDTILLSYGMPYAFRGWEMSLDNALMGINAWSESGDDVVWSTNPYCETTPTFGSDHGRFDHALYGFGGDMYLVARLDGPRGVAGVLELIDQALYGDRYVSALPGYYHGISYVDSRAMVGAYDDAMLAARPEVQSGSYDSYGATDLNIAYGEHYLTAAGLPMRWHQAPTSIGDAGSTYSDGTYGGTAPSALFYGGWYNIDAYAASAWDWLPGSVACDLDSSSLGADIRDPNDAAWGIQALQHGVTCVAGVIGEPYTSGHTRPNILLWAMVNGYTWAEATALANPAIGWKSYAIGDPLYRPFGPKTPVLDTQAPQLAGAPAVVGDGAGGVAVVATVADLAEPEVAQARVDYGATAAYGASVASPGYFKRHRLGLPGAGASFHYRVVLTDPAGNTASSGDLVYPGGQTDQPPVARIAASPSSGAAPLDVAFDGGASSDPDGAVVAYHWDFGDGSGADVAATHHQYAAAGTYTATLVVTDDGGAQGAATTTISVSGGGSGGSILFSDDFSSPSPDPAWTFVGASWSQAAGVLAQGSTQAGDPKKALLTDRAYPADVEVLARVRVDAWSAGDLARAGVGVAADGAGRGYNLVFHGDQQVQFLDDGVAWGNAYPFAWQVGTWYWFRLKRQGGVLSGKVWADGAPEPSGWPYAQSGWSDRAGGAPGLNGGSAGAGLGASTASFDDVTVDAPSSVEPPLFADDFSGATLAGAWSAAGSGGAWSAADGAAHQTSTADGDPKKLVLAGDYPSDVEIRARVRVDTWTTGDYARAGVGLRTDPATGEGYNLVFHGDQTVQFLDDRIAWGDAFPFAWQVGAWYWFALKIEGGTLSGKVWADGAPEPSGWPYVQSGWTSRAAGQPALNGGSASAGLGAATASFDDVEIDAIAPGGTGARERTDTDGEVASGGAVGPRTALCRQDP